MFYRIGFNNQDFNRSINKWFAQNILHVLWHGLQWGYVELDRGRERFKQWENGGGHSH